MNSKTNNIWTAASAAIATTLVMVPPLPCNASFPNAVYATNRFPSTADTLEKIYTTDETSLRNIISSILALFNEESDNMIAIRERLSFILDEDELLQDKIQLNKSSFIGLKNFINRDIVLNMRNASIFVIDDGSCTLTCCEGKKIYIKFIDENTVYYVVDKYAGDILDRRNQGYCKICNLNQCIGNA